MTLILFLIQSIWISIWMISQCLWDALSISLEAMPPNPLARRKAGLRAKTRNPWIAWVTYEMSRLNPSGALRAALTFLRFLKIGA